MKRVIAIDFDGTCVTHEYPEIGRDIGAVGVLRRLESAGWHIILWTMRSGKELDAAIDWFASRGIRLFGVNVNPEQKSWTSSPKAYAQIYIDDAALGCPLEYPSWGDTKGRPWVDWLEVEKMLEARGAFVKEEGV